MRINVAVPEERVSAPILNAALEGVTRLNEQLLKSGAAPTFRTVAGKGRVRWKPEPPGAEHFDHAGLVMRRGWGDCDDLGPWHAASLRVTGEDPGAHAVVRRSGPKRWHVVVKRSDGRVDDPSIEAGMPRPGRRRGVVGAVQMPMLLAGCDGTYIARPQLALRPHGRDSWQARTDLPWNWQPGKSPADVSMVSLHRSPRSDQALVGCVHGAIQLGECSGFATEDNLDHLAAVRDMVDGASWDEVAEIYGCQHADAAAQVVGSFFGKIFKKVTRAAKGLAAPAVKLATGKLGRTALSFVPGVGPVASMALEAASPHLRKLVKSGRHLPRAQRDAYRAALRTVPKMRGIPPHRHQIFTGPPIPL